MLAVLQFILAFGIVLFFLLITYYFVRKGVFSQKGSNVSVLERRYLDRKSFIAIVRIVDEYYVILVSDSSATIIKKLEDYKEGDSFSTILFRKIGRKSK
ncbi:flagellar biosynthetic protein FliO [Thermotoga sp. KOL6]|uniref:FliO/MopB family protein n=1 Tax=Thermotoga sp. KOL6 TaxID=126741 RepID=UPI000C76654E|nr:flagellar biosynthetic protein FliO [Thermotoga sp. KOL6]PLV59399.1 flagellar biosynthesis protein FliZ [Thermotoga sp. KOL6]